jgi:flavin reductase (DIM6/NTAB) family NADH-FMN oxidoreductase RutF
MSETILEDMRWTDAVELASPHPYVLVTTVNDAGAPNIIGIGWFTITSWKPPMVCISVAPPRHSHGNLEAVGEYVINFPPPEMARAAWKCGTTTGARVDKFADNGLEAVPSARVRPPAIAGSVMAWECRVVDRVDTGDHRLYIAEILATRGDRARTAHLYSIHYRELVAVDRGAGTVTPLDHK